MTASWRRVVEWRAVIRRSGLPSTARLVALALSDYMSPAGGSAYPGADRLADETGLGVRTVRRDLASLVELGYLTVAGEGGGRGRANAYAACFPTPETVQDVHGSIGETVQDVHGSIGETVQDVQGFTPETLHHVPKNPAPRAPHLSIDLEDLVTTSTEVVTRQHEKTLRKQRAPDALFDALAEACQIDPADLTPSARGALNRALKDLRAVGATPDEIHRRAGQYRQMWPAVTLTPTALARHWAECTPLAGPLDQRQAEIARVAAWAESIDREVS